MVGLSSVSIESPMSSGNTPGSALGYEILDQETVQDERLRTRTPDFEGYEVKIAPDQASFRVRLVDLEGKIFPGSERQVKLVETEDSNGYFFAAPSASDHWR